MYKIVGSEEDIGCDYRMGQRQASRGTGILGTGKRKEKERGRVLTYIQISASRKGK